MYASTHDVIRGFTADTGRTVDLVVANPGALGRRLRDGERADLVLNSARQLAAMAAAGLVDGTSIVELGRMRIGLGVRAGAPRPEIATPEQLKQALLAAPGVAYADPTGTPLGVHVLRMMDAMGIGTDMAPRSMLTHHGMAAAEAVAAGRSTLVLAQASEILAVPGVALVGLLPDSVNLVTAYAGAIATRCTDRPSAQALLHRLLGPEGQARLRQSGFLPAA